MAEVEVACFQIQVSSWARFVVVLVLSPQGGTRTRSGEGHSSAERVHGFEYEYAPAALKLESWDLGLPSGSWGGARLRRAGAWKLATGNFAPGSWGRGFFPAGAQGRGEAEGRGGVWGWGGLALPLAEPSSGEVQDSGVVGFCRPAGADSVHTTPTHGSRRGLSSFGPPGLERTGVRCGAP